jgi:lysophospholipase L1-like esterase
MLIAASAAVLLGACGGSGEDTVPGSWFSSWGASQNILEFPPALNGSTARMIVRPSISGTAIRVKIENTHGKAPVNFSGAFIGVAGTGAAVVSGTNKALTFGGRANLTLAPGAGVMSDAVDFPVKAFERLAVSLNIASAADASSHSLSLTTNYLASGLRGEDVSATGFTAVNPVAYSATPSTTQAFPIYWVAGVDVRSTNVAGTVVTFGDSITDGRCSTTTQNGALATATPPGVVIPDLYQRWVDVLANRFAAASIPKGVVNESIAGNRIIATGGNGPTGLDRLDRDVLDRAGATHVVYFMGTNDLAGLASSKQVIDASLNLISRVRAKGMKIIGVTMVPRGNPTAGAGFTALQEQYRLEVNTWMKTAGQFDGVIDFDALLTDTVKSSLGALIMKPQYACGDYIHPNAAGYQVMGNAIDLNLFK